jgi:hypothetical protein
MRVSAGSAEAGERTPCHRGLRLFQPDEGRSGRRPTACRPALGMILQLGHLPLFSFLRGAIFATGSLQLIIRIIIII